MAIIAVTPAGDVDISSHKLQTVTGKEFVRQKISRRFQFFAGEWFMDRRQGLPWFRDVFVKNPNKDLIRSVFRRVLLTTPGVASAPIFQVVFDLPIRHLSFDFTAVLAGNVDTLIVLPKDRDFIVDVSAAK